MMYHLKLKKNFQNITMRMENLALKMKVKYIQNVVLYFQKKLLVGLKKYLSLEMIQLFHRKPYRNLIQNQNFLLNKFLMLMFVIRCSFQIVY